MFVLVFAVACAAGAGFVEEAAASPPSNLSPPTIAGSFVQGEALTASVGDWWGPPTSFLYQWQRCDSYADVIAADAPAAFWRLGERSGSSAADASGNGNGGTFTNSPTLGKPGAVATDPNAAVQFDGAGAYVSVADAASLKPASVLSVEAWVKTGAANGTVLSKPHTLGTSASYSLSIAAGKAKLTVKMASNTYSATSTTSVNNDAWHHLVGTFDGSSVKIYVDSGTPVSAAASGALAYTTQALQLGRTDGTTGGYLDGLVDEAAVYATALSATRVQAHYDTGKLASVSGSCPNISGATAVSYTPVAADVGKRVRVAVTATNLEGSATANSDASVVSAPAPINLTAPALSGTARDGETLSAGTGSWRGAAPLSYGYQWQRCNGYVQAVGADGLSGYWRLGESSGAAAADSIGSNGGTYVGAPAKALAGVLVGDANTAVGFDGVGDQVTLSEDAKLGNGDFTIEAWFKTTASNGTIWHSGDDGLGTAYADLSISSGKLRGKVRNTGGSSDTLTSTLSYTDGAWHHAVFTRSGATLKLYADGAEVASGSKSGDVDSNASTTIASSVAGSSRFSGVLDEVAVYKSALSAARVLAHFNARSAPCSTVGSNSSSYTAVTADVGASIDVTVTATNSAGSAAARSAPLFVTAKTKPLNTSPPRVTGSPVVGEVVSADPGAWDQAASYTYQWRRCTPYASVVAADGPVSHWRLGEHDPAKTDAVDSAGSLTGTYVAGPIYGFGGALARDGDTAVYLNGNSQAVKIVPGPRVDAGNFTLELWFKTSEGSGTYQLWFSTGNGAKLSLALVDGKLEGKASDGTNTATVTSTTTYADSTWHHVAFVRSGTSFKLYADGTEVASTTKSVGDIDQDDKPAWIGSLDDGTKGFEGAIDEVAFYASAISQSRIQAHRASALDPCVALSGQVTSTYTVAGADAGSYLLVTVGATNSAGTSEADSPQTLAAAAGAPVNTGAPTISGTAAIGTQLSASAGGWIGSGTITTGYQWQRCQGYTQAVTGDGPLRWYRLDDLPGTGAVDETGTSSAGTYSGAPRYATKGALAYDASTSVLFNIFYEDNPPNPNQGVTLPGVQLNGGDFTIEAWFKTTKGGQLWMSGSSRYASLRVTSAGKVEGKANDTTNSIQLLSRAIYGDDRWHHAAFVRQGSSFTLYVDGLQETSGTKNLGDVDGAADAASIAVAADGTSRMEGAIDEVAVYPSALAAARIQSHAKNSYLSCSDIAGATSSTYTPTSTDRGYRVNVKVTATNSYGSTDKLSGQSDSVLEQAASLDIPVEGGVARSLTPTLKVNALAGASPYTYAIELAEDDKFERVLAASGWLANTLSWSVPSSAGLKDGKSYSWRARARYPSGTTTRWSAPRSLRVKLKRFGVRDYWPIWQAGPLAVNEATGNLILSVPSPSYPSITQPLALSVTYNSLNTNNDGLGAGWTLTAGGAAPLKLVDHALVTDAQERFDAAEVVWPDGSSDYFNHIGNANSRVYQAPVGSSLRLAKNKDGSWTLSDNQGSIYSFASANSEGKAKLKSAEVAAADPGKGKITYTYNDNPLRLTEISDEAGRKLTLTWYALDPTSCPNARVCVKGPDNVSWRYIGADAGGTGGDLVKVNNGTRDLIQISYGANGRPSEIRNANDLNPAGASPGYDANHKVTVAYDASNRVTSVAEGPITNQTPSTSTWSFAYSTAGPYATSATAAAHGDLAAGSVRSAEGYTEITPPRQQGQTPPKKIKVFYDDLDHPLETVNLLGSSKRAAYNRADQLEWAEDEAGNPTDNSWDPVTNLLTSSRRPDPDGTGPLTRPETRYRYDELTIGTAEASGVVLHGLRAAYFTNADFTGRPAAEQTDVQVDFNWGSSGPQALNYRSDNFSVRWSGILDISQEGDYTFSTNADGNMSLVIGATLAIDGIDQSTIITDTEQHATATIASQPVHLKAGAHSITLEYAEVDGAAEVHLRYACPTCATPLSEQPVPTSALRPNWANQTSAISPMGRIEFSHYAEPGKGLPNYMLRKLGDGTKVITSFAYDAYGRTVRQVPPRGNSTLTIDPATGALGGNSNLAYATSYSYYAATDTAAPPTFCATGSAVNQAGQLKQVTAPLTVATSYVYDNAGRPIAKTDGAGTVCSSYSPIDGRLTSTKDANGNTTSYTYDPAGAVRTVTAADNTVTSTVYDESGAVKQKTDANNHTTAFAHDVEGHQTSVTDPLGHATTSTYDDVGNRATTTDALNHTTTFEYDVLGRLTKTTTPLGKTTQVSYDALGQVKTRTDQRGKVTTYAYNADGQLTTTTDPLGYVTSQSFDNLGRVASKTDGNNHTTSYAYDLDGNRMTETPPVGGPTTLVYDEAGRLASRADGLNHVTTFTYDGAGRLVSTTLPTGQVTRAAYDAVGNRTSSTDAAGKTTTYTYNSANRLIRERSPLGNETQTAYDAVGNVTSRTDPLNHTTIYAYDAADQLTATTDALNNTTTIAYDNANRKTAQTDANNHTTSYAYDNDDRLTSVTAPDGGVTTLGYDNAGNLTSRTDDNNHTTTFAYDDLNRLVSKTDPLNRTWTYEYDGVGNKTKVVDANGNGTSGDPGDGTTAYVYDASDRQTSINYSDATPDVGFSYDLAGRRIGMTDGAGTQSYVYDDADRLVSVIRGSQSFVYAYDAAGRLASRTYPDGTITSYGYDDDSRLATIMVGPNTTAYTYDAASRLTATVLPNGWSEQRSYDNTDRLTDIRSIKGPDTLAAATYTRDNIGNPTTIVRDGVTETYSYDNADRITAACYGGQIATCPTGSKITYAYDRVGNRTAQTKFGTTTTYSYDAADQLASTTTGGNTTNYSYDNDGQQTGQGTKTFTYNLAGQLTQAANSGTTLASFSYDGAGNRLTKTASSVTTTYYWDENNTLPMLALEQQGSTTIRDYAYGDQLLSMNAAGAVYYFHHDGLDTTSAITKSTGATEWTYTYTPYGEPRTTTKVDPTAPDNPIQYTGELIDPETGLYDLRARTYNPTDGRFLTTDPLAQDGGDPALSIYLYANAAPLLLTDPSGQRVDPGDGGQNPGPFTHPCSGTGWWINDPSECDSITPTPPEPTPPDPADPPAVGSGCQWPCGQPPTPGDAAAWLYDHGIPPDLSARETWCFEALEVSTVTYGGVCNVADQAEKDAEKWVDDEMKKLAAQGIPLSESVRDALLHAYTQALEVIYLSFNRAFGGYPTPVAVGWAKFFSALDEDYAARTNSIEAYANSHNDLVGRQVGIIALAATDNSRDAILQVRARLLNAVRAPYEEHPPSGRPDLWVLGRPGNSTHKPGTNVNCIYSLKRQKKIGCY